MYKNVKKILVAAVVLIALDFGFMNLNKNLYTSTVVNIQRVVVVPKYAGFVGAYVFILAALYCFILRQNRPSWEAALLGLAINGIYESTNYGIFKKWSIEMALIDTLWGGVLFGLTTACVYQLV